MVFLVLLPNKPFLVQHLRIAQWLTLALSLQMEACFLQILSSLYGLCSEWICGLLLEKLEAVLNVFCTTTIPITAECYAGMAVLYFSDEFTLTFDPAFIIGDVFLLDILLKHTCMVQTSKSTKQKSYSNYQLVIWFKLITPDYCFTLCILWKKASMTQIFSIAVFYLYEYWLLCVEWVVWFNLFMLVLKPRKNQHIVLYFDLQMRICFLLP